MKYKRKSCKFCQCEFDPKFPSHLYCTDDCSKKGLIHNYYVNQYGISLKEVTDLLNRQNWKCAICKEEGFNMNQWVRSPLNVDHCHETKQVRGLLCHNCNRALGLFKDSIERLSVAITYLQGATTISSESTPKSVEAHNICKDDDIVCSHEES